MPLTHVTQAIDELIDRWASTMSDEEFIESLEEMEDRARVAIDARKEEVGDK